MSNLVCNRTTCWASEDWGKGSSGWESGLFISRTTQMLIGWGVCVCDGLCAYVVLTNQIKMVNFTVWLNLINKVNENEMFKLPNLFCFVSIELNIYKASRFNFQEETSVWLWTVWSSAEGAEFFIGIKVCMKQWDVCKPSLMLIHQHFTRHRNKRYKRCIAKPTGGLWKAVRQSNADSTVAPA